MSLQEETGHSWFIRFHCGEASRLGAVFKYPLLGCWADVATNGHRLPLICPSETLSPFDTLPHTPHTPPTHSIPLLQPRHLGPLGAPVNTIALYLSCLLSESAFRVHPCYSTE